MLKQKISERKQQVKAEEVEEDVAEKTEKKEPKKKAPVKKAPPKKKPARKRESVEKDSSKRTFKILAESIEPKVNVSNLSANGGRYTGNSPMQAAKKAYTQISRSFEGASEDDECRYVFTIQETTRGSQKKTFKYVGHRINEPHTISKNGNEINIKYKPVVKAFRAEKTETKAETKEAAPKKKVKAKKETVITVEEASDEDTEGDE